MKFYIAGRFSRQKEFKLAAQKVIDAGHYVTSRWLDEVTPKEITSKFQRETARIDLEDIDKADAMIFYAEDPYNQPPRGGRHVEFGYALAYEMPIFVIGAPENVFHHLGGWQVRHFDTLEELLDAVSSY